jgi:hypothetical protein
MCDIIPGCMKTLDWSVKRWVVNVICSGIAFIYLNQSSETCLILYLVA